MNLDNSYARLPSDFHVAVRPDTVSSPKLLAWNRQLAAELGLDSLSNDESAAARVFSGAENLPGFEPIALAYAGHQFGHFAPQLGDGRAALLGEVLTEDGGRYDIQLKGSGRTAFSRGGDGKSWLGPVLREYILSEAMHCLGVPTTRALAVVATGDTVHRDGAMPGAVFARVASSHVRVGTFEYFAVRQNLDALKILADYTIDRHYPEAKGSADPYLALFRGVAERQSELIAHWMAIGFIHGVMNTDNTSIAGESIDYGPAAFMDEFQFDKVFSSIDHNGRYRYANQPTIAQWNLARFAESLLLLGVAKTELDTVLAAFPEQYESYYVDLMRPKFGLQDMHEGDAELIGDWLNLLQDESLDYTLSFRCLAARVGATDGPIFGEFETRWLARLAEQENPCVDAAALMNSVNPLFIPRNHRVEQAIQQAVAGDYSVFEDLNTALSEPFIEQSTLAHYAEAPEPNERVTQTFCGT